MEDDQNGRRPKWKTTKMEDDQNGRRPKWKTIKMEDDQNGRRPKWKTTKVEDDQNGRVVGRDSLFWPDLGQIFSSQTVSHVGKENGDCWGRILGIYIVLELLSSQWLTNQREFVSS